MTRAADSPLPEARSGTYRLLARLALAEIDAPLAQAIEELPVFGQALADSGGPSALPSLRAEYTRTFLMNVHPYESVYLDESGMLNTPLSGGVLEHYREHGYEPEAATTTGAPDHLGLELGFMAHLVEREAATRCAGNGDVAEALRADQLHFLADHLVRWAPIFGHLLAQVAASPFYRALGQVVERFVLGDYESLASGAT